MATTQLADIFVADYYGTIAPVNSPEKTAVFESGIITKSPELDAIAQNGQGTSEISYWQDLDADEEPNISTRMTWVKSARQSRAPCAPVRCTSTKATALLT